jgi:hypothetical protein
MALVDENGVLVAAARIRDDAAGLRQALTLLAEHDPVGGKLPVAIETSQGLLVAGLRAAGRQVFAINPLEVSRYRNRSRTSRGSRMRSTRSDPGVAASVLPGRDCSVRAGWSTPARLAGLPKRSDLGVDACGRGRVAVDKLASLLRAAGRQRGVAAENDRLLAMFGCASDWRSS